MPQRNTHNIYIFDTYIYSFIKWTTTAIFWKFDIKTAPLVAAWENRLGLSFKNRRKESCWANFFFFFFNFLVRIVRKVSIEGMNYIIIFNSFLKFLLREASFQNNFWGINSKFCKRSTQNGGLDGMGTFLLKQIQINLCVHSQM